MASPAQWGTLKSPAYLKAVAHLFRLQRRLMLEFKEALARYDDERAEYTAEKQKAKKGSKPTLLSRMRQAGLQWNKRTYYIVCVGAGAASFLFAIGMVRIARASPSFPWLA